MNIKRNKLYEKVFSSYFSIKFMFHHECMCVKQQQQHYTVYST